ncbi:aminoglycoside phosphotransferase family protein [Arenibaculum pallidiluteum]|uniref:aminoglycoside phosphotransferase family protein n=1 Tax=Arenibaculum pallidiluteum TaxID=2812559 RepID=UPI001A972BAF|nr:aminoglycoside phosphotransferase family protein [Arenibaculum pallidiluteum]
MGGDGRVHIDEALVRDLIRTQFPCWSHLPVAPVPLDGWDNRTFRLGSDLKMRLPSARSYVPQVEKEYRWLPALAPRLPFPIPAPVALGSPAGPYPFPWSVYRWLDGAPASRDRIGDMPGFARDVARFLLALREIDPAGGPPAGPGNFHRGGALQVYDAETRATIGAMRDRIDVAGAIATWEAALRAAWTGPEVWVHGDVAVGNLLVEGGGLSAVIDFGSSAVGDPACDLVLAWTFLSGESRSAFRNAVGVDAAMWARARGWALWKALLVLAQDSATNPAERPALAIIEDVVGEHALWTR